MLSCAWRFGSELTLNQRVLGSIPGTPTKKIKYLDSFLLPSNLIWGAHGEHEREISQGKGRLTAPLSVRQSIASTHQADSGRRDRSGQLDHGDPCRSFAKPRACVRRRQQVRQLLGREQKFFRRLAHVSLARDNKRRVIIGCIHIDIAAAIGIAAGEPLAAPAELFR